MTTYTRKPTVAEAFQYDRQPRSEWPKWLQDYEVATPMGFQGVGAGAGVLLVPNKNGPTINVTSGEWVVYENGVLKDGELKDGVLLVFRNDLFEAAFQANADTATPADEPALVEEETPNTPPVEAAAATVTAGAETTPEAAPADAGAKGRRKPAAGTPAAEDGEADA